MPVTKSAKKKLRQDLKRTQVNKKQENELRMLVKKASKTPSEKTIRDAVSAVDKAVKNNLLHKNKAARMKSSLSKLQVKDKKLVKTIKASSKAKSKKVTKPPTSRA